jgi:hypothetical protein
MLPSQAGTYTWNAVKWRQGFLRIYIVAVVVWELLMLVAAVTIGDSSGSANVVLFIFVAIILPVVVYVLVFLVIPWITKGFK